MKKIITETVLYSFSELDIDGKQRAIEEFYYSDIVDDELRYQMKDILDDSFPNSDLGRTYSFGFVQGDYYEIKGMLDIRDCKLSEEQMSYLESVRMMSYKYEIEHSNFDREDMLYNFFDFYAIDELDDDIINGIIDDIARYVDEYVDKAFRFGHDWLIYDVEEFIKEWLEDSEYWFYEDGEFAR